MNRLEKRRQQSLGGKTVGTGLDPIPALLRQGLAHQQAGRLDPAADAYRRILAISPGHMRANHLLGLVEHQRGNNRQALSLLDRALSMAADDAAALTDRGVVLNALTRHEEAVEALNRANRIRPGDVRTLKALGGALIELDRLPQAAECCREAASLAPGDPSLHNNLGVVLNMLGETGAAIASFNRALTLDPNYVEAHSNLGHALAGAGRYDEALAQYREALRMRPGAVSAWFNLAMAVSRLGRQAEAVDAFHAALTANPKSAQLLSSFGGMLGRLGRARDAIDQLALVLEHYPDDEHVLGSMLFMRNYLADDDPAAMITTAQRYGRIVAARAAAPAPHANSADPDRRIKVGLVSGDFRTHSVARFLIDVLPEIDPRQVELFAYSTVPQEDEVTARLMSAVRNWRRVSEASEADLAEAIRRDGIDILVDLSGHTANHRLPVFARKPAPIALTWLGYFSTTGIAEIDYVLGNRWVLPEAEESQWVEKPWRMPETYLCFSRPGLAVPVAPPPADRNGYVTFGSYNNLNKMSDRTVEVWAGVLRAVPGSRLLLRTNALEDPVTAGLVRQRFGALGIAAERLVLEGKLDYEAHLASYGRLDIALDPFPYTGGTTTVEALWMGTPVLTLKGDRFVAHMGESILHNAGLPEWIATDADDYVARAAAFAADLPGLAALRAGLRARIEASPLMDAPRFARHLETAFRKMWQLWCTQQRRTG